MAGEPFNSPRLPSASGKGTFIANLLTSQHAERARKGMMCFVLLFFFEEEESSWVNFHIG